MNPREHDQRRGSAPGEHDYASSGAFRAADDDDTSPGVPLGSLPPLPSDVHESLGVLMGATARNGRHIASTKRDVGVLRSEVVGLRKDFAELRELLEQDRSRVQDDQAKLVHESSKAAAKKSATRVAAWMGSAFGAYEILSPYIAQAWRLIHK
jgi:hypothetical protein